MMWLLIQAGYIHQHIPMAFFIAPGHGAVDLKTDGGSKDVFISAMTTPRKNESQLGLWFPIYGKS